MHTGPRTPSSNSNTKPRATMGAVSNPFTAVLQNRSRSNNPSALRHSLEVLANQTQSSATPPTPRKFVFRPPSVPQERPLPSPPCLSSSSFVRSTNVRPLHAPPSHEPSIASNLYPPRANTALPLSDIGTGTGGVKEVPTRSPSVSITPTKLPVPITPRDYHISRAPALSIIKEIPGQLEDDTFENDGQHEGEEYDEQVSLFNNVITSKFFYGGNELKPTTSFFLTTVLDAQSSPTETARAKSARD